MSILISIGFKKKIGGDIMGYIELPKTKTPPFVKEALKLFFVLLLNRNLAFEFHFQ